MKTLVGIAAVAVLASVGSAQVYDNGAADYANGNEMTAWLQAEDFVLGANASVGSATAGLLDFTGGSFGNWDGGLQWFIFNDAGGIPGAIVASGKGSNVVVNYVGTPAGFDSYELSFDFGTGVALTAGTQYHFGLHMANDYATRRDIYWATTGFNATNPGTESSGGTMNNWLGNGFEHAFALYAVPAPSALALLGLGGIAAGRRRR
jgi:hypothetical protein